MVSLKNDNQGDTGGKYCFAIDRGGTFTDIMCMCPDGRVRTLKLLSEDPARYADAPREGIRRILKEVNFDCTFLFSVPVLILFVYYI